MRETFWNKKQVKTKVVFLAKVQQLKSLNYGKPTATNPV